MGRRHHQDVEVKVTVALSDVLQDVDTDDVLDAMSADADNVFDWIVTSQSEQDSVRMVAGCQDLMEALWDNALRDGTEFKDRGLLAVDAAPFLSIKELEHGVVTALWAGRVVATVVPMRGQYTILIRDEDESEGLIELTAPSVSFALRMVKALVTLNWVHEAASEKARGPHGGDGPPLDEMLRKAPRVEDDATLTAIETPAAAESAS